MAKWHYSIHESFAYGVVQYYLEANFLQEIFL